MALAPLSLRYTPEQLKSREALRKKIKQRSALVSQLRMDPSEKQMAIAGGVGAFKGALMSTVAFGNPFLGLIPGLFSGLIGAGGDLKTLPSDPKLQKAYLEHRFNLPKEKREIGGGYVSGVSGGRGRGSAGFSGLVPGVERRKGKKKIDKYAYSPYEKHVSKPLQSTITTPGSPTAGSTQTNLLTPNRSNVVGSLFKPTTTTSQARRTTRKSIQDRLYNPFFG